MKKYIRFNKDEFNKYIRQLVMNENRTLFGSKLVFPESPLRYNKTKFDVLAESGKLDEGLIRSYPLEWVERYVTNRVNSDFIKGGVDDWKFNIWFVMKPNSPSIVPLKKKLESFGYHCAVEDMVKDGLYLQFEPKFDIYYKGSEFVNRNNNVVFYHVSPLYLKDKILKKGLIPKSNNEYLKFPDRAYMTLASTGKDKAYEMAEMLYNNSTNPMNKGIYVLYGITLNGLVDVKFYTDRNTLHTEAYFTYENIPPTNVYEIEEFEVYKY